MRYRIRQAGFWTAGVVIAVTQIGCGSPGRVAELVEADAAVEAGAWGERVVYLDVRSADAYAAGHVNGAASVDPAAWKSASLDVNEGLENVAAWESRIGAAGVGNSDRVLIYDGGEMANSARIWFILQHFGHERSSVVNGGWPAMKAQAEGGKLTLSNALSAPAPRKFSARVSSDAPVSMLDRAAVREAIESGRGRVVDARQPSEHAGDEKHANPRGGHLPGAVNIPHTALLTADGRLKSPEELAAIFEAAGLKKGEPLITHCESGGRSSLEALAAVRAGYGPVKNYYRSFSDWSKDEACPVERK